MLNFLEFKAAQGHIQDLLRRWHLIKRKQRPSLGLMNTVDERQWNKMVKKKDLKLL